MDKRYYQYTMRDDFDIVVNFSETLVGCKLIPETTFKRAYNE
jgi:hypothetical protein